METAKGILARQGGIAKAADFIAAGMGRADVVNLCNAGYLERLRHGYYQLAGCDPVSEPHMLSSLIPQGVVCVESALFYYGYTDFTPRKWSIAVPRSITRSKLVVDALPLHVYYVSDALYGLGKTTGVFQGMTLPVYDRERTICDCVKHRSRLDRETFAKALAAYAKDPEKNLQNLSAYAKKLRVYNKIIEWMEVLLNG